jgi:hypothetical protein
MSRLADQLLAAVDSLGLTPVPLGTTGDALDDRHLCAVLAAPDASRARVRMVAATGWFSTFTNVLYDPGAWVDLDATTAALAPEAQHAVLRDAVREAARRFTLPVGCRGVPFSLLLHPNDTRHEVVAVALGDSVPVCAVAQGHSPRIEVEALHLHDAGLVVIGLDGEGFGVVRARVVWADIEALAVDDRAISLTAAGLKDAWSLRAFPQSAPDLELAARLARERVREPWIEPPEEALRCIVAAGPLVLGDLSAKRLVATYGLDFMLELLRGLATSADGERFARLCFEAMTLLVAARRFDDAVTVARLPQPAYLGWVDYEELLALLRAGRATEAATAVAAHLKRRRKAKRRIDEPWVLVQAVIAFRTGALAAGRAHLAELERAVRSPFAALAAAFDPERPAAERAACLERARWFGSGTRVAHAEAMLALLEAEPWLATAVAEVRRRAAAVAAEHAALASRFEAAPIVVGKNSTLEDESGGSRSIWADAADDDDDEAQAIWAAPHRYGVTASVPLELEPDERPVALAGAGQVLAMGTSAGRVLGFALRPDGPARSWALSGVRPGSGYSLAATADALVVACRQRGLCVYRLRGDSEPVLLAVHDPVAADAATAVFVEQGPARTRVLALGGYHLELFDGADAGTLERRAVVHSDNAMRGAALIGGDRLVVAHQNLGGVALYDVADLGAPKLLEVLRLAADVDCGFALPFGDRVLVQCDRVVWVVDVRDGTLQHGGTTKLAFTTTDAAPALRASGGELVLVDRGNRRAVTVLELDQRSLRVRDVLPLEGNRTRSFAAAAFVGDDGYGALGDAPMQLLRLGRV